MVKADGQGPRPRQGPRSRQGPKVKTDGQGHGRPWIRWKVADLDGREG